MGAVGWVKGCGEELSPEQVSVRLHRELHDLRVKVRNR